MFSGFSHSDKFKIYPALQSPKNIIDLLMLIN